MAKRNRREEQLQHMEADLRKSRKAKRSKEDKKLAKKEKERKKQEKARLFMRDLSLKRKDLELYHSVLDGEITMYRVDWNIETEKACSEELSDEMMIAGVRNVIRYCAPSVAAVVTLKGNLLHAVLLTTDAVRIPTAEQFTAKAYSLMDTEFSVTVTYQGQSDRITSDTPQKADLSLIHI